MGDVVERPELPCGDAKSAATYDRAPLESLLARVERAAGPDREIDGALMALMYDRKRRYLGVRDTGTKSGRAMSMVWADRDTGQLISTHPKYFTASIDAALALVERRFPGAQAAIYTNWPIRSNEPDEASGGWRPVETTIRGAWVRFFGGPGCEYMGPLYNADGHCRSAPLAILAALLKALLADQSVGRESDDAAPERTNTPGSAS